MTASPDLSDVGSPVDVVRDPMPGEPAPRRRSRRPVFWGRLSIQSKLLVILLLVSILSALVVGLIGYRSGRDALRKSAFERLTEVRESRTREARRLFGTLQNSLVIYTRGRTAIQAVQALSRLARTP